jgi:asparagine synthase (glutamine-hydrolysing)
MLQRIAQRGPDGQGQWTTRKGGWHIALGHRRLAVLDIAGGAQPMATKVGSTALTYNGEIYNFRALRRELEGDGAVFHTHSDTEVVLQRVAASWTDALLELDGMFAFGLWDGSRNKLLLARDRAGIKPLYYAPLRDGGVVFASELTALLAHPDLRDRRRLSAAGLKSYFFADYFHPPHTLIEGVFQLPPGRSVEWSDGRLSEPSRYWTLRAGPARRERLDSAPSKELWTRLSAAVDRQLVADVPVGVFLSGGLDSSCVATLAQRHSSRRLKTFSIGFEEPSFDESDHARALACRIGSEHIEQRVTREGLLDLVDLAFDRLGEPLADPSYLPTFLLSSLAAKHVKVVLCGDGGDELFAGYPTYLAHRYARLCAPFVASAKPLGEWIAGLKDSDGYQTLGWKVRRFFLRWDNDSRRRHLRWMSNLDLDDLRRALPSADAAPPATLADVYPATTDSLNAILALDFCSYLPGSILTKADRASMAHGLEVRPPLLDNMLVDWAFSLPSSLKLHHGRSKHLLKLAAAGHVPDDIIRRRKKGFGVPLGAWLRRPLRGRLARALEPSALWDSGLLAREAFVEWSRCLDARRGDYARPLWALIVLDDWIRREKLS